MADPFAPGGVQFRCPGCDRVIDGTTLHPGERFKCAKCKKIMRFGPHLFDAGATAAWRTARIVLLVACVGATVWILTLGYDFALRKGSWGPGFGGAIFLWLVVAGCIGLAARTTQSNWALVGVTSMMSGVGLLFVVRLGRHVGYNVGEWERYRLFPLWAPALIVGGAAILAFALVVQGRSRSL